MKINEIKKVLMRSDDSDSKVSDIEKIIYGSGQSVVSSSMGMDIEAV